MTRLPQVTSRELLAFLKAQGFIEDRQKGSHLTLRHPVNGITVTIPMHSGCDVGRGMLSKILKDAGLSVDEFLRER